jgi:DNA-binding NarL/FixJ family response regulator
VLRAHEHLHVVGATAGGLKAVRKAEQLKPSLILLDIGLPDLNGIETARRIRELLPDAEILFVTQHNDADIMMAALNNETRGYLLKMDAASELLPAIEAVLRGEKFVSPRLMGRVSDGGRNDSVGTPVNKRP